MVVHPVTIIANKLLFLTWISVCVFFTIDTGAFLYPSLSQTLLGETLIAVFGIVSILCLWLSNKKVSLTVLDAFVISWMFFLILHSTFMAEAEHYKLNYMVSCLSLTLPLSKVIRYNLLSTDQLECGLLAMLVIQLAYISLQAIGLMQPYCTLYSITGTGDNPNTAAILLAMCVPIIIRRLKRSEHTWLFLFLLLLIVLFLMMLKCRTAYIGLFVAISIQFVWTSKVQSYIKSMSVKKRIISVCMGIILISIVAASLYNMKKDSADGRLLVWKLSTQMIADNPMGHGMGMFERYYNLRQGEYFASGKGADGEKSRASIVSMAYNDVLEQGVETGLIGALFVFAFYIILLFESFCTKDVGSFSMVCAFMIMSIVNFIYSSMQPWILLLTFVSMVMAKEKEMVEIPKTGSSVLRFISVAIFLCMAVYTSGVALAQAKLKTISDKQACGESIDKNILDELKNSISTSSAYYLAMSREAIKSGEYKKALACLDEASKFTSVPAVFFDKFKCLDKLGRTADGIKHIKTICNILPQNLLSRVILLNWYHNRNKKQKALAIAHEIADMHVKVANNKSKDIQRWARQYINENE